MELTLFLSVLFVGGVVSTVAGGGLAVVILVLAGSFLPPLQAVALTALLGVFIQLTKALAFYTKIQWRLVLIFGSIGLPCAALGSLLLVVMPTQWVGLVIGTACILGVFHFHFFPSKPLKGTVPQLLLIGAGSGFVAGLLGYGANMRMAALRRMHLQPQQIIATASCTALVANIGRLPVYVSQLEWTDALQVLIVSSIPTILISVWIGKVLHKYVPVKHLEWAIDVIVVIGGLTMIVRAW